jgi:hypothetical protein
MCVSFSLSLSLLGSTDHLRPWHHLQSSSIKMAEFLGGLSTIFFFYTVGLVTPRPTPTLEDQASVFISPRDRVAQLYPQAPATHFSRLLRHAWVTVVLLFLFPGHHTGIYVFIGERNHPKEFGFPFSVQYRQSCLLNAYVSTQNTCDCGLTFLSATFHRTRAGIPQWYSAELRAGCPGRGWVLFSSPPHPDRLWGPLSLLSKVVTGALSMR